MANILISVVEILYVVYKHVPVHSNPLPIKGVPPLPKEAEDALRVGEVS